MPRLRRHLAVLFVPLSIAGCSASLPTSTPAPTAGDAPRLAPGDRVEIAVAGAPEVSGVRELDLDGRIELPVVGAIEAHGRTPEELATLVEDAYAAGYLRTPEADVALLSARPYFISGDVERPGSYPFARGMTVAEAVLQAGGPRAAGAGIELRLIRQGEVESVSEDRVLAPGDIIELRSVTG